MKTIKRKRQNQRISVLLLLVMMLSMLPLPVSAASADIFDKNWYAAANPDVVAALGRSEQALRQHYQNHGRFEGRSPSSAFDPAFYLNVYPDLKAAFGNNFAAALDHYLAYGIQEGRRGSAQFHVSVYKDNYADLRNAFGTDNSNNYKYVQHWLQHGQYEKRNAVTSIATPAPAAPAAPAPTTATMQVSTSTGASLNVRAAANTSSAILGKLSCGSRVEVVSISNGWAKIQYNNRTGYVSAQYLAPVSSQSSSQFWQWPLDNHIVSQTFNHYSQPMSEQYGRPYHAGMDLVNAASRQGEHPPIKAAADGVVEYHGFSKGNGNHIVLRHSFNGTTVYTLYSHLQDFDGCPQDGQAVSKGQKIGSLGSTGNSSGPHVHFAIFSGQSSQDPVGYTSIQSASRMTTGGRTFYNPALVLKNQTLP